MLRITILVSLLVACAGCSDTDQASSARIQPGRSNTNETMRFEPTIPEEKAVEIAKAEITERED